MKHSIKFLTGILTAILCSFCLHAESFSTVLTFNQNDFTFEKNSSNELSVTYNGMDYSYMTTATSPALPVIRFSIPIPAESTYQSCSLQVVRKKALYQNTSIAVAPEAVPASGDNISSSSYNRNYNGSVSPASTLSYVATSTSKYGNVVHISFCPFEYNSTSKVLYIASDISLVVNYTTGTSSNRSNYYNPELKEIMKSLINIPIESSTATGFVEDHITDITLDKETWDYVIITSEKLMENFAKLKDFKNSLGIRTKLFTVEEIALTTPGADKQEKIKKKIQELQSTYKIKYVLLGGDETIVPTRNCYVKTGNYEDFTPADNYYICFNGAFNWDGNGNGIYGEVDDNLNFDSQIFISRLPVRTPSEVDNYIYKLYSYQIYGNRSSNKNKILMGGAKLNKNFGSHSDAYLIGENFYTEYIEPYWNGECIRFFDTDTDLEGGANYDFTPDNLQNELKKGYSFVEINTHGNTTVWGMELDDRYHVSNANSLTNNGLTVITTSACHTNAFDNAYDPCLSEAFIRSKAGGIMSYLGSSRYGWFWSNSTSVGPSLQYEGAFYESLMDQDIIYNNYAKCVAYAKARMLPYCDNYNAYRWLQMSLNPIGDAEFHVYTEAPTRLSVPKLSYTNGLLEIVTDDLGCDITVCSYDDGGDSYYYSLKRSKGALSLKNIDFNVYISITQPGYLPIIYRGEYTPSLVAGKSTMKFISGISRDNVRLANEEDENEIESIWSEGANMNVKVKLSNNPEETILIVTDITGNVVDKVKMNSEEEDQTHSFSIIPGFYVVTLYTDGQISDQSKFAIK
ncbi:MAG: T9SS type A sorting domain-containing protein [Bacteroides sp.]|nr:T9SS type A sorting domain-containing protein [Bacteroides sp.]